ncbi:MAG TPA: glycosyltransferase family A protein [Rhizomicrobium sp.]|nr:glycosyltransferase family A protein [Rhizomicrobium sp.]
MSWRNLMEQLRPHARPRRGATEAAANNPIAILSFNRPHYLSQVLDSLLAQTALGDRAVLLFQDNAVSPFTGKRFAQDEDIEACVDLFREKFPTGTVVPAEHNLGIARNFLRAEERLFLDLDADAGYFFEDDMVLSPHYLTMMDQIYGFARKTERIAYFAAYGGLTRPLEEQKKRPRAVQRFTHNWGFGLMRRHWKELREWLEPYYRLSEGRDYKDRRTEEIARHYWKLGAPLISADQDVMKQLGTCELGRVSINTLAVFAKYIGAEGVHFDSSRFETKGFSKTEMYPEPVELEFPSNETLERFHADERKNRQRRFNERMTKNQIWRDQYEATMGPLNLEREPS